MGVILAVPILLSAVLVALAVRSGARAELVRGVGGHLEAVARSLMVDVPGEAHELLGRQLAGSPVARSWAEAPAAARHWNLRLSEMVRSDDDLDLVGTMRWRPDHVEQVARHPKRRSPEALTWVLSSGAQPSFTMREPYLPDMAAALFDNASGRSGILDGGDERWIHAYAPVRAADGRVLGLLLAGCEVEARLNAIDLRAMGIGLSVLALMGTAFCLALALVRRLEREAEEQGAAASIRGELLTNAQLQVREPLDGVLGMADLLLDGPMTSEEKAGVEIIRNQGHALRDVMQNIVDYADLEAGVSLALNPTSVDLLELCERLIGRYALSALQRRVDLHLCFPHAVPRNVIADGARLEQVLGSVLGNALRFTRCGEVVFEVSCEVEGSGGARLGFEVRDTGRGIPCERQEGLFESFQRLEGSVTRRLSSPELGLDIARRVVETLGGAFDLESTPGHGSRVGVTLPAAVAPGAPLDDSEAPWGQALVVDDRESARQALSLHLSSLGLRVIEAYDRESALAMLALSRFDPFKVIVMAQELPDGDASAVAAVLRRDPGARGVPVIVLVAGAVQETRILEAAGGPLGILTKPVRRAGLAELLHRLVATPDHQGLESPRHDVAESPCHILVGRSPTVDDAVEVRLLRAAGHHVDVAESGVVLVQAFRSSDYDLVLVDAMMRDLDGYAATRALRELETETGRRVPILGLSSQMLPGDRERALDQGMDDYLVRPVGRDGLLDAVRRWTVPANAPTPEAPIGTLT